MRLGFIGFGNMGRALAEGLLRKGALAAEEMGACARDFDKLRRNTQRSGIRAFRQAAEVVDFADTVVVAVKPHQVEEVLAPLRELLAGKILISVVSGYDFAAYEKLLSPKTRHISAIPNTPIAVGEGIMICEDRHSLRAEEMADFEAVFGRVAMLESVPARLFSIAGTLSGCTPAYTAMYLEALADAGVKHGMPRATAYRVAAKMLCGTGRLYLETGTHPGAMKDAVCSRGGTTIRGVAALERGGFRAAVLDAIDAAEGEA